MASGLRIKIGFFFAERIDFLLQKLYYGLWYCLPHNKPRKVVVFKQ